MDDDVVADQPDLGTPLDLALGDAATGNLADLGDVEYLQNLRIAEENLAQGRGQQPRHRRPHVVDQIVNDVVVADLHTGLVGEHFRLGVGTHVKTDHHGPGSVGKRNVGFGHAADAGVDNARLDL